MSGQAETAPVVLREFIDALGEGETGYRTDTLWAVFGSDALANRCSRTTFLS